jgi:soluble lytic murein transglycosylase-like protein
VRVAKSTCVLIVLIAHLGTAQTAKSPRDERRLSGQWVEYYATVYRVPVELVEAIIDEESDWNPYAVSRKGAVGLMQLMPQTAVRFGVRNRFRLNENIRGGVAYLACLYNEFGGDLRLVTAAYYVGEAPILLRRLEYSSADVQRYVSRIAGRYRVRKRRRAELELAERKAPEVLHENL